LQHRLSHAPSTAHLASVACRAVDTPEFAAALIEKGYTELVIQKGAGQYCPCQLLTDGKTSGQAENGLKVQ
jgi:hypothetical protein